MISLSKLLKNAAKFVRAKQQNKNHYKAKTEYDGLVYIRSINALQNNI